jgi:hypothetical protein
LQKFRGIGLPSGKDSGDAGPSFGGHLIPMCFGNLCDQAMSRQSRIRPAEPVYLLHQDGVDLPRLDVG